LKKKRTSGFTFLELMVVISIFSIIAIIAIPNYSRFRRRSAMRSAANTLANDIRRAVAESKKKERNVAVWFKMDQDPKSKGIYYMIVEDINDDLSVNDTDILYTVFENDAKQNPAIVMIKYPVREYLGAQLQGPNVTNDQKLIFSSSGKVDDSQTDLPYNSNIEDGNDRGYYRIIVAGQTKDGEQAEGDIFYVRIYWDGAVEVEQP